MSHIVTTTLNRITCTCALSPFVNLYPKSSYGSKFSRSPAVKIPQQTFHLQHPSLVTVAMHGGPLPSPVYPIGTSVQPGSLKTAFYITAYNERGFISVLSKCQSGFNDLLRALAHTAFSALLAFSVISPIFIPPLLLIVIAEGCNYFPV